MIVKRDKQQTNEIKKKKLRYLLFPILFSGGAWNLLFANAKSIRYPLTQTDRGGGSGCWREGWMWCVRVGGKREVVFFNTKTQSRHTHTHERYRTNKPSMVDLHFCFVCVKCRKNKILFLSLRPRCDHAVPVAVVVFGTTSGVWRAEKKESRLKKCVRCVCVCVLFSLHFRLWHEGKDQTEQACERDVFVFFGVNKNGINFERCIFERLTKLAL